MDIYRIAVLAIACCFAALIFKASGAAYGMLMGTAAAVFVSLYLIYQLSDAVNSVMQVWAEVAGDTVFLKLLFRLIGITYVTELAAGICRDCGYQALSGQITIAGKIGVVTAGLPVVMNLLDFLIRAGKG